MPHPIIIVFLLALLTLAAIVLLRTLAFSGQVESYEPVEPEPVDAEAVAKHLAAAIKCQTISNVDPGKVDVGEFHDLHRYIRKSYPGIHRHLDREVIGKRSLLYTWKGSQSDLKPLLFAGHIDVVPVDTNATDEWSHPPFEKTVADGFVWGRGALDNKNQVIALLESVEILLGKGFQPRRTIYLAFGGDEEVGGRRGAKKIVKTLQSRGVELAAVLDEGGSILESALPGVKAPLALVGVAEKGFLTLEISVEGEPGHSSQPPPHTTIGILARSLALLEARPMPLRLAAIRPQIQAAGKVVPFVLRMVYANLWLFGCLVRRRLASTPRYNAAVRTTTAITMISGGVKDNILPSLAKAVVNFRLLPGDDVPTVIEHVRRVIGDDKVKLGQRVKGAWNPSPISPVDSPAYTHLSTTIRQIFSGVPVIPYLVMGATDARHYAALSRQVYRFSPVWLEPSDLRRVHGTDERIAVEALARMVQFYLHLIPVWAEEIP